VRALEAAHEKAIIHGDLKPVNVKITHDGKVKVNGDQKVQIYDEPTSRDLKLIGRH
jgi:serine/threonine protein kinase